MKKTLFLIALVLSILQASAQTYVSGGIYTNTTWTKAASPYIVTDTVFVFQGVVLTIEPGVTVKFEDKKSLEIREASLIAIGNITDSITFTSNSTKPTEGSWGRIFLNKGSMPSTFKYCNFRYAQYGIGNFTNGELIFNHCIFRNNIYGIGTKEESLDIKGSLILIDSSTFKYNTTYGIWLQHLTAKLCVNYCNISNNYRGLFGDDAYKSSHTDFYIKNSTFDSNYQGITPGCRFLVENCHIGYNGIGISSQSYCKIINCIIRNNDTVGIISASDSVLNCQIFNNKLGVRTGSSIYRNNNIYNNIVGISGGTSTIVDNIIKNNNTGVVADNGMILKYNSIENDSIGIRLLDTLSEISCNKICNNWIFGIQYQGVFNTTVAKNYWCTPDSASTVGLIFDGYDDPTYGLAKFMPLDTSCYKTLGIKENKVTKQSNTKLYPNPFCQTATLEFENPQNSGHQLSIFNTMGQMVLSIENIKGNKVLIDRKELQSGLYFYQLRNEDGVIGSGKIMIE